MHALASVGIADKVAQSVGEGMGEGGQGISAILTAAHCAGVSAFQAVALQSKLTSISVCVCLCIRVHAC